MQTYNNLVNWISTKIQITNCQASPELTSVGSFLYLNQKLKNKTKLKIIWKVDFILKIIDLIKSKNAFDLNCKYDGDMQLALKVIKFVKAVETEADFYDKKYSEILSKYAEKDESGNIVPTDNGGIKIQEEHIKDFSSDVAKLNSVDVEKPNFEFTVDELNKCDLTGNGLYALYPFIKDMWLNRIKNKVIKEPYFSGSF